MGRPSAFAAIGPAGLLVAAGPTPATICFITALWATTVADVTILYATAPFIAAGFAWAWTRERPGWATLASSALALTWGCDDVQRGSIRGRPRRPARPGDDRADGADDDGHSRESARLDASAACLSAFACAALVLPLAHPAGDGGRFVLLGLFGTTQFGLGLLLLTIGGRLIPAARASLLVNLELPFAPLWVWLAFGELPSQPTYVGGGIVCAAVLLELMAAQMYPQHPA